jgi:two-component sensor histidine kinase
MRNLEGLIVYFQKWPLLGCGIEHAKSDDERQEVFMLNLLAFYTFASQVFGCLYNAWVGVMIFAWVMVPFCIATGFVFVLNHRRRYRAATHLFFISVNIFIFISTLFFGIQSGLQTMYFPLILSYSFVFNKDRIKDIVFYTGFSAVFFILFMWIGPVFGIKGGIHTPFQEELFITIGFLLVGLMSLLMLLMKQAKARALEEKIEEQERIGQKLRSALNEREILLAEVYHRVKNNLSVVSSMINLQMNLQEDEHIKQVLNDCRNRINSMALVHQKFYRENNFHSIDFCRYALELCKEIQYSLDERGDVDIQVEGQSIPLDLNDSIPCGIILNELITNSFKHAFRNHSGEKQIKVKVTELPNSIQIRVSDNGPGFNYEETMSHLQSLGLVLIESLAGQLDATFRFTNQGGTQFVIEFPKRSKTESREI